MKLKINNINNYKLIRTTFFVAAAFFLLTAAFIVVFLTDTKLTEEVLSVYMPQMQSLIENGKISLLGLFKNNLFACALCMGLGIIPILYFPAWALLSNAMLMGAVLAFGSISGTMSMGKALVFGMLPHGIFELPAIFLSVAMGLTLCKRFSFAIFGMKRRTKSGQIIEEEKILAMLNRMAKIFVTVVIPLLVMAALVETYVTPQILSYMGMN